MEIQVLTEGLSGVDAAEWDALIPADDPFTTHAFLAALERSGCVGPGTGWVPRHLLLRDRAGRALGAMPLYLKDDSYGEYIFDWSWAEGAYAAGIDYYPKLVSAVPFTPVTGGRLLTAPGPRRQELSRLLLDGALELAAHEGASSVHLLFLTPEQLAVVRGPAPGPPGGGFLPRLSYQFHWHNRGYRDFDDYLSCFRASARKQVRRERRRVAASGLTITTLPGEQLDDGQWQALWRFYRDTTGRKWGRPYLNRAFFQLLRERLAGNTWVALALDGQRPVAGSLLLHSGGRLLGRYWGCLAQHQGLHFELCYYQPIQLSIERGWSSFEAGAQGVHKLKRGLLPRLTHSAHWFADPALAEGVGRFVAREAAAVRREVAGLGQHAPFRRDCEGQPCGALSGEPASVVAGAACRSR